MLRIRWRGSDVTGMSLYFGRGGRGRLGGGPGQGGNCVGRCAGILRLLVKIRESWTSLFEEIEW
jgi:hypothetical protein